MNTVFGECGKHPGNNMVNCQLCAIEKPILLYHRNDEKDKEKFLSQLLHEIWQVLDGFAQDEVWSEYDESVRQRVIELQKYLLSKRKDDME